MTVFIAVNGIEIGVDEEDLEEFLEALESKTPKTENSTDEQSLRKTEPEKE